MPSVSSDEEFGLSRPTPDLMNSMNPIPLDCVVIIGLRYVGMLLATGLPGYPDLCVRH